MKSLSSIKVGQVFVFLTVLFVLYVFFSTLSSPELSRSRLEHDMRDIPDIGGNVKAITQSISTFLVVLILSSPQNYERRDTIRKTWLSKHIKNRELGAISDDEASNVRHYFAIGLRDLNTTSTNALFDENSMFNDLLLLDIEDGYTDGRITDKLLAALNWIAVNVHFTHLLKTDDDSFVRLDALITVLRSSPTRRFYFGHFRGDAQVRRDGKWADRRYFLCDRYLPYAHGGGYVLSSDLVDYVTHNADMLERYANEDVSVGVWLAALRIERRHDRRFDTEFMSRGCSNAYLVTHKQSVEDMRLKWKHFTLHGKICDREVTRSRSFEYNWNVPPSQCCNRTLSDLAL